MGLLRLLTDEHISPAVTRESRRKERSLEIVAMREWREGSFLGTEDEIFLPEVTREGLTFVTYDQRTIRPLLKMWAEIGIDHAGFVFVDEKTIAPQDIGGLVRALSALWEGERGALWVNRIVYLKF